MQTPKILNKQISSLHTLFSVLRLDKQNRLNRELVKKHQEGTLGKPSLPSEEEDMIQFGDNITHQHPSSLLPVLLSLLLGAGGASVLWGLLASSPPPSPISPIKDKVNPDTDTKYSLEFVP